MKESCCSARITKRSRYHALYRMPVWGTEEVIEWLSDSGTYTCRGGDVLQPVAIIVASWRAGARVGHGNQRGRPLRKLPSSFLGCQGSPFRRLPGILYHLFFSAPDFRSTNGRAGVVGRSRVGRRSFDVGKWGKRDGRRRESGHTGRREKGCWHSGSRPSCQVTDDGESCSRRRRRMESLRSEVGTAEKKTEKKLKTEATAREKEE